jgi:antirestriction protein
VIKAGVVRRVRWSGQLLLLLREHDGYSRRWDCLELETGEMQLGVAEKWLIHDTDDWRGQP